MKKLVQINTVCNGSTGKIMCDIAKEAENQGYKTYCFYGRGNASKETNCIKIGNNIGAYFHVFLTRIFDKHGHGSYFATKKLVKQIKSINPDVINLHNLHGYYLNIGVLFKYLKNDYNGKIIWTFHDCWPFTGHCTHFVNAKCNKWKKECNNCPQKKEYPKSILFDSSFKEFNYKKQLFTKINNLEIVVASSWMNNLIKDSFLKEYPVTIIKNGIDINLFKPMIDKKIYQKYNIPTNKKIILGVSSVWNKQKGINIFKKLSEIIDKEKYVIVMVGLKKEQLNELSNDIIKVLKTDNQTDLVKLYSIADVFVNPSIEESFSLVTVEALACNTPIIVPNTTATEEFVINNNGLVVEHNLNSYYEAIKEITSNKSKYKNANKNIEKYKRINMINNYLKLYGRK